MPAPPPDAPAPAPLHLSVTELLAGAAGGPSLPGLVGFERLWLGARLHRLYQDDARARDPTFEAERALALDLAHEGRAIRLHGRADGVREAADGALVVEELKSEGGGDVRPERAAQDALQASLYAWMLARACGRAVRAVLVRIAAEGAGVRVVARRDVAFDAAGTEARARALLSERLREERRREALREARRARAGEIRFPFPAERPGQREMADAVAAALAGGRHLLLEAPTGLGKTAAVLLPALRFAYRTGARVFLLTSRSSQQRGALEAAEAMAPAGAPAAAALRAKAALCATGTLVCHEDHCRFARDYARRRAEPHGLAAILASGSVFGADAVRAAGVARTLCPHALAGDLARDAALTVADQSYLVDPFAALPELRASAPLGDVVLLLDEAHQVAERARAAGSASLPAAALRALEQAAAAGGAPAHAALRRAAAGLRERVAALAAELVGGETSGDGELEAPFEAADLAAERAALETAGAAYLEYRLATRSLDAGDPLVAGLLAARRFFETLERAGPGVARSVAFARGEPSLRLHDLEPERRLAPLFARCRAVVALSATLRPFDARRALLGLDEARTDVLAVPSPFPAAHRAVVIDARVDDRWRARAREAPRLARRLAAFAEALPGHALALAPSFAWLDALRAALPPLARRVLVQRPDDDEAARARLLAAVGDRTGDPILLLAVAGGWFGEGVDWPGALAGVALIGPCLPPPDLPRELLRRALDERFGAGFELAYALPGMTRVVQGAGRLLRSERDRGVVALFGRRFLESPYRDLLPPEWLAGGAPEDLVGDPARVARAFFADA